MLRRLVSWERRRLSACQSVLPGGAASAIPVRLCSERRYRETADGHSTAIACVRSAFSERLTLWRNLFECTITRIGSLCTYESEGRQYTSCHIKCHLRVHISFDEKLRIQHATRGPKCSPKAIQAVLCEHRDKHSMASVNSPRLQKHIQTSIISLHWITSHHAKLSHMCKIRGIHINERMGKWLNEWIDEQMNEWWMAKWWMNERMKE